MNIKTFLNTFIINNRCGVTAKNEGNQYLINKSTTTLLIYWISRVGYGWFKTRWNLKFNYSDNPLTNNLITQNFLITSTTFLVPRSDLTWWFVWITRSSDNKNYNGNFHELCVNELPPYYLCKPFWKGRK